MVVLTAVAPCCVGSPDEARSAGQQEAVRESTLTATASDLDPTTAAELAAALVGHRRVAEHARCAAFSGGFWFGDLRDDGCVLVDGAFRCAASQPVRCTTYEMGGLVVWGRVASGPGEDALWNGSCGEVAAANVLSNLCGRTWTPLEIRERSAGDWTPGTRPETLAAILNAADCGEWVVESGCPGSRAEVQGWLAEQYFVPILISSDPMLHWVTLYSMDDRAGGDCFARVIDRDGVSTACGDLERAWSLADPGLFLSAVEWAAGLQPCTRLRMRRPPRQLRPGVAEGRYLPQWSF